MLCGPRSISMSNASDESAPGRRVCWSIAFSALDAYGAPSLMAVLRLSEFERLLSVRYARTLPDADAGDDDLFIAVQFMPHLPRKPREVATNSPPTCSPRRSD